jgi:hypothetical protein
MGEIRSFSMLEAKISFIVGIEQGLAFGIPAPGHLHRRCGQNRGNKQKYRCVICLGVVRTDYRVTSWLFNLDRRCVMQKWFDSS